MAEPCALVPRLFYAESPAMKAFHDAYDPGLLPFLAEAMAIYADSHL